MAKTNCAWPVVSQCTYVDVLSCCTYVCVCVTVAPTTPSSSVMTQLYSSAAHFTSVLYCRMAVLRTWVLPGCWCRVTPRSLSELLTLLLHHWRSRWRDGTLQRTKKTTTTLPWPRRPEWRTREVSGDVWSNIKHELKVSWLGWTDSMEILYHV